MMEKEGINKLQFHMKAKETETDKNFGQDHHHLSLGVATAAKLAPRHSEERHSA